MVTIDPIGLILNAGAELMKTFPGGSSLLTVGMGVVVIVLIAKFWYAANLIVFLWLFWKSNKFVLKQMKNGMGFITKWVLPLAMPAISGEGGLSGKAPTVVRYEVNKTITDNRKSKREVKSEPVETKV